MNFAIRSRAAAALAFALLALGPGASRAEWPATPWVGGSTRDSIRYYITAEYLTAARTLAAREVAEATRRFGAGAPETIDPLLLEAEALLLYEYSRSRGIERIEEIDRISQRHGASAYQRGMLERLRGIVDHMMGGRYPSARAHFDRADTLLASSIGTDNQDYGTNLIWRARTLRGPGRGLEAVSYIERACAIFERLYGPDNVHLYDALDYLASSPKYDSDPASALVLYERVLAGLKRGLGAYAPRVITTYYRMSGEYYEVGRLDRARQLCEQGVEIVERNPDDAVSGAWQMYSVLAIIELEDEDYIEAERWLKKAIDIVTSARGIDAEPNLYSRLQRVDAIYHLGRIDEARTEVDAIARACPDTTGGFLGQIRYWRGMCSLAVGDTASARADLAAASSLGRQVRELNKTGATAPETGYPDVGLALCEWLAGRPAATFDLALSVERDGRAALRRSARSLSDADALSLERIRGDGLDLALSALIAGLLPEDATERAFDSVVRSRAVVLDAVTARHLGSRTQKDSLATALGDSLRAVERQMSSLLTRGTRGGPSIDRLEARRRILTAQLAERSPTLARSLEGEGIGGAEVAAALDESTRLISIIRFGRHEEPVGSAVDDRRTTPWYAAFTMTGGDPRPRLVDLGSAAILDAQVERWLSLASRGPDGEAASAKLRSIGDSLRRRVWDPLVQANAKDERILLASDGAIALLPIAALPSSTGGFLLEEIAPIALLSAERDLVTGARTVARGTGLLALGDPDFSRAARADSFPAEWAPGQRHVDESGDQATSVIPTFRGKTSDCSEFRDLMFSQLTQSGAEVRDLAAIARDREVPCATLLGPEASEESFKRFGPGRRFVHVASHGFALSGTCKAQRRSRETPLVRAGVALAGANARADLAPNEDLEDGILTAEEVAMIDLTGAECVVLSACESGVGDVVTGEGVLGMRRAFYQSGARTLVSSLWKVDDATARAWMREFYRELLGDHPEPADAAHAASLTVLRRLRKGGQEPSPALWGAFVVSGVPEVVSAR